MEKRRSRELPVAKRYRNRRQGKRRFEIITFFLLIIILDKGIDINQCLNLFTIEEKLREGEEWYCPHCKEHQQAFKHMQIWKLPPVLILHLKRFHYNRIFRDKGSLSFRQFGINNIQSVCDMVHFPTRGLDMSPYLLGPGAGKARFEINYILAFYLSFPDTIYLLFRIIWGD